jgi:predicted site-specific integrase-resolvase
MNLAAWARANRMHPQTADRWLRQGTMPVPARRLLADPRATMIVVEHRDRLARFGVEYLEAALSAQARRLVVVVDPGDTGGDLVGDMVDVLTGVCARRYGRRGGRNRALRAVTCANQSRGHAGAAGAEGR